MAFARCRGPLPLCSACRSVSLSSPAVNTENGFYCKTHTENAYYFLKAIIACVVFSLLSLSLTEKEKKKKTRVQSVATSAMFTLRMTWLLNFFAMSPCWKRKTANGSAFVPTSV